MQDDVLTKPFQGKVFREFQSEMMNCPINYEDDESIYEDVDNTTGVYNPSTYIQPNFKNNGFKTRGINNSSRTSKPQKQAVRFSMDLPQ